MGDDHHKPDRYSAFARNWKLIGITSRKKWQKSSIQDKVLWRVLERISKSEQGDAIIRHACYEAGLLDGEMLQSELGWCDCDTTGNDRTDVPALWHIY
ncbi:MAG: hypothetical protein U9N09_08310 [Euryarchaeota archaeon]|nr:hypothetical protein [Euryarchaeota archaeon]